MEKQMSDEEKTMALLIMKDYEDDVMHELTETIPANHLESLDITSLVHEVMIDVYIRAGIARIPLGDVSKVRNHLIVAAVNQVMEDNDWTDEDPYNDDFRTRWAQYNDE
jgi:hypothetical protein